MDYTVKLQDGDIISLGGTEIDAAKFTAFLNDPAVLFINLGGAIVSKGEIKSMLPKESEAAAGGE